MEEIKVDLITSFTAGALTFLTPCILPIIPIFLAFVAGLSTEDIEGKSSTLTVMFEILAFIAGLSSIFIALGYSAGALGSILTKHRDAIRYVGGAIALLFGIQFIFDKYILKFGFSLSSTTGGKKAIPFLSAFIMGVSFSLGWSPCIGPILATILLYAASSGSAFKGAAFLLAYSLGFGIPLFITGLAINKAFKLFSKITAYLKYIRIASGGVLIAIGLKMLFG